MSPHQNRRNQVSSSAKQTQATIKEPPTHRQPLLKPTIFRKEHCNLSMKRKERDSDPACTQK